MKQFNGKPLRATLFGSALAVLLFVHNPTHAATVTWQVDLASSPADTVMGTLTIDDTGGNHISAVDITFRSVGFAGIGTYTFTEIPGIQTETNSGRWGTVNPVSIFVFDPSGDFPNGRSAIISLYAGVDADEFLAQAFLANSFSGARGFGVGCNGLFNGNPICNNGKPGLVGEFTNLSPVPLPGAVWLFGSALMGLVAIGRKRKPA